MKSDSVIERGKGHLGVSLSSTDEATHNDQNDMARLGKPQQFNVSISQFCHSPIDGCDSKLLAWNGRERLLASSLMMLVLTGDLMNREISDFCLRLVSHVL